MKSLGNMTKSGIKYALRRAKNDEIYRLLKALGA